MRCSSRSWIGIGALAALIAVVPVPARSLDPTAMDRPSGGRAAVAVERDLSRAIKLQGILDAATPGATLVLEPGVYAGPATVSKPLTLDGSKGAVLDGGGKGTILRVETSGVTLKNLEFRASGVRHEAVDACVTLTGKFHIVKDNRFVDCLFGVNLHQASNVIIRRNDIDSVEADIGQRGEGIRLWYSNENLIEGNRVHDARDVAVWYSKNNRLIDNEIVNGRYGIHFMYSHENVAARNRLKANTVGIFLMYSNNIEVNDNAIHTSQGPSGIGIGLKESSGVKVAGNDLFANAVGLFLDASPYDPDAENVFANNRIAYNGTSIIFHSDWPNNRFTGNRFVGNHLEVAVNGGGGALKNSWSGNDWDVYEGFDRDGDGVGDTPFEAWAWSDRLWMDVKSAQFFRASPALEAIDFVERLAPISQPRLLLRDAAPRVLTPATAAALEANARSATP